MTDDPVSGWQGKLAARQEAAAILTSYLLSKADVETARIVDTLKFSLKAWVFVARINGQKVVVKRFFDADPAHTVNALKGELNFVAQHLGDGDCQVNRCLMAWPAEGTVVLSFARGPRLSDKIAQYSGLRRRALLAHSGRWLAAYTAPRLRHTTFGPRFWVQQMAQRNLTHMTDANDRALMDALLDRLRAQVPLVRGCPVVQGATHGDFVGINAHFHGGVITGVDIQGECWLALSKEAARFLVWEQIHNNARPDQRQYGIDAEDWGAFLSSGLIVPAEQSTTLPFFIGEQLFGRLAETSAPPEVMANTRAAIHAYVDALT